MTLYELQTKLEGYNDEAIVQARCGGCCDACMDITYILPLPAYTDSSGIKMEEYILLGV